MRAICRRGWLAACLLLISASAIRAESKPDLTSPKKAATAFAVGLQAGDFNQVKASSIGDESDYKLMQTVASTMSSVHKLHEAAVSRFGVENAKKLETGVSDNNDIPRQIEASDEKLEGDSATILEKGKPESNAVHLKKVNGDWKVDLSNFPQKQIMRQTLPMLDAMRLVMTQSASDVSAGHYKNAEDAATDVRLRMSTLMATIAKQQLPTTTPSPAK